jgi:hypothetical protein
VLIVHGGHSDAQRRSQGRLHRVADMPRNGSRECIDRVFDRLADQVRDLNGQSGILKYVDGIPESIKVVGSSVKVRRHSRRHPCSTRLQVFREDCTRDLRDVRISEVAVPTTWHGVESNRLPVLFQLRFQRLAWMIGTAGSWSPCTMKKAARVWRTT